MKMNKIFNWTFGSIFRTLGRVIAYVIIGIIVVLLFNFNAIKKPKISNILNDIFFMQVKADTITGNDLITYYKDSSHNTALPYPSGTSGSQYYLLSNTGNNIETDLIYLSRTVSRNSVSGHTTNYIRIPFMITGKLGGGYEADLQNKDTICQESYEAIPSQNYNNAFDYETSSIYNCTGYANDSVNAVENVNVQLSISLYSTNGEQTPCLKDNDSYKCELKEGLTYNAIYLKYSQSTYVSYTNGKIRLNFNRYIMFYENDTSQIINNQNQNNQAIINNQNQNNQAIINNQNQTTQDIINNQNQQTQAINNTLTDSNTTQSEGEASSFFSNFNTSDNGGLTSIITAPLSAIQSLTNASCSPLVLPLPFINENLTLPCMRTIYETHFGAFMVLYDTITIGIISYWILVRIFNMVKDFKNPDHDEIEVVDL